MEKHDHRIMRIDVVVVERDRPREPEKQVRVELTAKSKGPIVRAEAVGEDKMSALDLAVDKMQAQMRRAADRRKVHRGNHTPESVHAAMSRSVPADAADEDEAVWSAKSDQSRSLAMVRSWSARRPTKPPP
ncbi:MAG: ribosome-associated translation inhibitor RaiA [Marmoricola sp.]